METEEQMARRLGSTWTQKFGWEYDADTEAEIVRVVEEEMAKDLKRKAPTVSDKIPRLPNK